MRDALIQGYLSLSKTNKNILMWSHYAQNHEGFVLGFDSEQNLVCQILSIAIKDHT
ncbi:hypothetical protein D051_4091 [Vibrio parahaemolyticus VPCR-2010]|nr:hypothetical protein D051_4091 [Vibrio parahaemolyticus VPCR-2010]